MKTLILAVFILTLFNAFGQKNTVTSSAGFALTIPGLRLVEENQFYGDTVLVIDYNYGIESATIYAEMNFRKYFNSETAMSSYKAQFTGDVDAKESERTFNGHTGVYLTVKGKIRNTPTNDDMTVHYFYTENGDKKFWIYVIPWEPNTTGLENSFEEILNSLDLK